MKSEESRIPLKHELEHAVPTVIHDPEQDMNLLERSLRHAMANPFQFWGTVVLLVAALTAVSVMANGWRAGGPASSDAWNLLEAAKTPSERVEIAKQFPNTPAERFALLQAATEYYSQGFNDLPANKDAALPTLKKALDLFQKVADEAPKDSGQARAAALGAARTLEARNELDKAAEAYRKVADTKEWAGTPEAKEAANLAEIVKRPETAAFYTELYAFKAPEATLPPGGIGNFDLNSLGGGIFGGAGTPPIGGGAPVIPDPANVVPPPPPTAPPEVESPVVVTEPEPKTEAPKAELPADPFAPAAPKVEVEAETPPVVPAEPKAEPVAPPGDELPDDPFAPAVEPKS